MGRGRHPGGGIIPGIDPGIIPGGGIIPGIPGIIP